MKLGVGELAPAREVAWTEVKNYPVIITASKFGQLMISDFVQGARSNWSGIGGGTAMIVSGGELLFHVPPEKKQ